MPISVPPLPQLDYRRVAFDPSTLSGLGDALLEMQDRRKKKKDDREAGDVLGRWADETYADDNKRAYAGGDLTYAGMPGRMGSSGGLGAKPPSAGPVNNRVDQAFDVAGEPPRSGGWLDQVSGYDPSASAGLGSRLLTLDDAPAQYRSAYADAGQRYGVDPGLLVRQGKQESGFDPNAVSRAGARGIAQFMPDTAAEMGVDPSDPQASIDGQGRYMAANEKQFGENQGLALAAYNWGPGNVQKWIKAGADPNRMPAETRSYVQSISGKPIESWLQGAGDAGPDAGQPHQGMTINGTRLPSRDVMMAMLRNPETRPIAAKILSAVHQDRTDELPADAQEYLFAIRNGFNGDYPTWVETKARSGRSGNQAPPSYRMRADGTQEYVPGGPADPDVISRNAHARSEGRPARVLPQSAVNKMTDTGASLDAFDRLSSTFEDSYGGKVFDTLGAAQNWAGRNLPGGILGGENGYADQAQFWQDYQTTKNTIRHTLFGSALTATEKGEFDKANIAPGMSDDTIKTNLARQKSATLRAAQKLAGVYTAQGYSQEVIEAALGYSLQDLGTVPPPGFGAPTDPGSDAQLVEIDGKTYYVSPDGQVYE